MRQKKLSTRISKMTNLKLTVFCILAMSSCALCAKDPLPKEKKDAVLKLRTMLYDKSRNDYSEYEKSCPRYLEMIEKLMGKYDDFELKEIFAEGVLASFPRDGKEIGLKKYADRIKTSGDGEHEIRARRLDLAIAGCDDILRILDDDKDNKIRKRSEKETSVKLQKAELLMFRWLVKNVNSSKGGRVGRFPDDMGDLGVSDREDAIDLIYNDLWKVPEAQALVNQCGAVLRENSSWHNKIYFHRVIFFFHESLANEVKRILRKQDRNNQ